MRINEYEMFQCVRLSKMFEIKRSRTEAIHDGSGGAV